MAEAEKKAKKPVQIRDKEGNLLYRVTESCMYRNEFFARGQIVRFPEGETVEHSCIQPLCEGEIVRDESPVSIYDPYAEHLSKARVDSARAGIIGA